MTNAIAFAIMFLPLLVFFMFHPLAIPPHPSGGFALFARQLRPLGSGTLAHASRDLARALRHSDAWGWGWLRPGWGGGTLPQRPRNRPAKLPPANAPPLRSSLAPPLPPLPRSDASLSPARNAQTSLVAQAQTAKTADCARPRGLRARKSSCARMSLGALRSVFAAVSLSGQPGRLRTPSATVQAKRPPKHTPHAFFFAFCPVLMQ